MSRALIAALAVSAAVVGLLLLTTVKTNQSNLLRLEGQIDEVQIEPLSDGAHLVLLNFVIKNPSERRFEVKRVEVAVGPEGEAAPGGVLAKRELASWFEYKQTEPRDPPLGPGDVVKAGERVHRIVGARFESAQRNLDGAFYTVRIRDINDVVSDIASKPSK